MGILEKLKAGARHQEIIDWPVKGVDVKILIKTLTEADYSTAKLETDNFFKGRKVGAENVEAYESEFETRLLYQAIFDPESPDKPFTNITDFRALLSPEIKDFLAEKLDTMHSEHAPDPDKLDDAQYDKIVDEIKKNARNTVESISSLNTLRKVIVILVNQLSN